MKNALAAVLLLLPALPAAAVQASSARSSLPTVPGLGPAARVAQAPAVAALSVIPALAPAIPAAPRAQAEQIAAASGVDDALSRLTAIGALPADAVAAHAADRQFQLKRIWDNVSPALTNDILPVDRSWAIPAITARASGKTYLIHPVTHGYFYPPNKRAVRALSRQIEKSGHALYWEENLPLFYGSAQGREILDHAADAGQPVVAVPAARHAPASVYAAIYPVLDTAALGGLAWTAWHAVSQPGVLSVTLAAAAALAAWLLSAGLLPLYRMLLRSYARRAVEAGSPDMAEQLEREIAALARARVDAAEVLRLHLPPAVAAENDPFATRSAAMAAAGAADASGADVIHFIVGHKHAADIGWRLRSQ